MSHDPYFGSTKLLLPLNGTDGGTSFPDATGIHLITAQANARTATGTKKFGTAAGLFTDLNTTSYITVADSAHLDFGNADFTIELWAYFWKVTEATPLFIQWYSCGIYMAGADVRFYASTNNSSFDLVNGQSMLNPAQRNRWYHIAVAREGSFIRGFIDGVQVFSVNVGTSAIASASTGTWYIGGNGSAGETGCVSIDDLRITKGLARYKADFTPPVEAHPTYGTVFLANMASEMIENGTTFIDEKGKTVTVSGTTKMVSTQKKFGVTSAYFDNTVNGKLSIDSTTDFDYGSGAFTIEFQINTALSQNCRVFMFGGNGDANALQMHFYTDGALWFGEPTGNNPISGVSAPAGSVVANQWQHIAMVWESTTTYKIYVNGVLKGSSVGAKAWASAARPLTMGHGESSGQLNGYIDEVRITKGVARYTGNFTAPTAAFPMNSTDDPYWNNVVLLMHMDSIIVRNKAYVRSLGSLKGCEITASVFRQGGSSLKLTGDGFLGFPHDPAYYLSGVDFTIEAFVNFSSHPSVGIAFTVCTKYESDTAPLRGWGFDLLNPFGQTLLRFYTSPDGGSVLAGNMLSVAWTPTLDTWYHLAVTRKGTTTYLWIDGVMVGSLVFATNVIFNNTTVPLTIGAINPLAVGNGANKFVGYIDDVRITKGWARYE